MKEFIKKRYNILIPVFLVIVILIAVFLYTREYKNSRYSKTTSENVYQYFSGVKLSNTAKISRNKNNAIVNYETDSNVSLDSTPIYIENKESTIFPKEMDMVFPLTGVEKRLPILSEIYKENGLYYVNINRLNKPYDDYFLYDGRDLYYFVSEVTILMGSNEVKLSPMSYVSCSYHNLLEYYDKGSDSYVQLDYDKDVIVYNDSMRIDVSNDKILYKDGFKILTSSFEVLDKLSDDKK